MTTGHVYGGTFELFREARRNAVTLNARQPDVFTARQLQLAIMSCLAQDNNVAMQIY